MSPSSHIPLVALLLAACAWSTVSGSNSSFFTQSLIEQYGTADLLSAEQVEQLLVKVRELAARGSLDANHTGGAPTGQLCDQSDGTCLRRECLSAADLFSFHQFPSDGANITQVSTLVSGLLYQLQNQRCSRNLTTSPDHGEEKEGVEAKRARPGPAKVWGYSFLSVTIINICPVLGIFFYPLMKTQIYKKVLMCTVGLAVGTLSASAIVVLIPEGFELLSDASPFGDIFRWRAVVVVAGIYSFFLIERVLSFIFQRKERQEARQKHLEAHNNPAFQSDEEKAKEVEAIKEAVRRPSHSNIVPPPAIIAQKWAPATAIKSVAWMIVIGDALHNFMDGLSIGSAYTESPPAGLGISLAIFSEELPHELGDFAVLLNAGMSLRQAAVMNFVSAISCYLGMIAGIQIGQIDDGAYWVFALTGGMFLYISLVGMLPEMNEQAREEEERTGDVATVFILQNVGLVVGWVLIFLISFYSEYFPQ